MVHTKGNKEKHVNAAKFHTFSPFVSKEKEKKNALIRVWT